MGASSRLFGTSRANSESELLVRVMVGEDKKAARADVLKGGPPPLGQCVVGKIRAWDLSPLGAAPGDQIVFPLAFHPEKAPDGHSAVEARLRKLALKKRAKQTVQVEHPSAWFVAS